MAQGTCVKCGAEDRYLPGRSLCAGCYDHHWTRGTLDEWPRRPLGKPTPTYTSKVCPICEQDLPLDRFAKNNRRPDGRGTYCKPCAREKYHVPARERKRQVERPTDGEQQCVKCGVVQAYSEYYWEHDKGRYRPACKACCRSEGKRYWRDGEGNLRQRQRNLKHKFGLSEADYEQMLAEQSGGCAICGRTPGELSRMKLAVDHCHRTGKVRALLCGSCNTGIGMFHDNPEKLRLAALYVERHSG